MMSRTRQVTNMPGRAKLNQTPREKKYLSVSDADREIPRETDDAGNEVDY